MNDTIEYDPEIDNCADMPGCGDERVLFTYFGPMACCPGCYERVFGAAPDGLPVITIPVGVTS